MPRHGDVPEFLGFDEVVGVFRVLTEVDLDPFDAAVECWVTRFVVIGDAAAEVRAGDVSFVVAGEDHRFPSGRRVPCPPVCHRGRA
jgi:hypothetical protein